MFIIESGNKQTNILTDAKLDNGVAKKRLSSFRTLGTQDHISYSEECIIVGHQKPSQMDISILLQICAVFLPNLYPVPGCGGLISLQVGGNHSSETVTFTSPGYPEGYASMLNCEWIFETTPGNHLALAFLNMDVEQSESCYLDSVKVYKGKSHV
jgi:hypothetical protein